MVITPQIHARVDTTTASIFHNVNDLLHEYGEQLPLIRYDGGLHVVYGTIYIKLIHKRSRLLFALIHEGVSLELTWNKGMSLWELTDADFHNHLPAVTFLNAFWRKVIAVLN
jgi:hypothetical protein